jgi:hypothetical protein
MKHNLLSVLAALVILAGCATTSETTAGGSSENSVFPSEISAWIAQNGDRVISGVGASDLSRAPDALRQARTLALQDLASSVQAEVAAITRDFLDNAEARGQTERVAQFNDSVGVKVQATVEGAQTFGPYKKEGTTYIVRYIQKTDLEKDIADIATQHFQEQREQINQMLGL